jgi:hypothetical protein
MLQLTWRTNILFIPNFIPQGSELEQADTAVTFCTTSGSRFESTSEHWLSWNFPPLFSGIFGKIAG